MPEKAQSVRLGSANCHDCSLALTHSKEFLPQGFRMGERGRHIRSKVLYLWHMGLFHNKAVQRLLAGEQTCIRSQAISASLAYEIAKSCLGQRKSR